MSTVGTQRALHFSRTLSRKVGYNYLLHLPPGARAGGRKRWPLILFLHGMGERGLAVWRVAKHGPPRLLRQGASRARPIRGDSADPGEAARILASTFIVVSPQCPPGKTWDGDALLALLDEISVRHPVDRSRIYATGLSMGGYGTWGLAVAHPERFAAIAPVCGGGLSVAVAAMPRQKKEALRGLGVWAFHGARDLIVPVEESERMVVAFRSLQVSDLRLTVYPKARHDSWTETYANPELYSWFLRHRRGRR